MKITKFEHSCLLVEMPEPTNRTVLFDPGTMSEPVLDVASLQYLDDIFITHKHGGHLSVPLVKKLLEKFPDVRITAPADVVSKLSDEGITASSDQPDGVIFFDAPHESVEPLFPMVQELGFHYLNLLSHPGDSHHFNETKQILALPIYGPWGSTVKAVQLALELKPKYILPIHDYPLRPEGLETTYDNLAKLFQEQGITFMKLQTGQPVVIEV